MSHALGTLYHNTAVEALASIALSGLSVDKDRTGMGAVFLCASKAQMKTGATLIVDVAALPVAIAQAIEEDWTGGDAEGCFACHASIAPEWIDIDPGCGKVLRQAFSAVRTAGIGLRAAKAEVAVLADRNHEQWSELNKSDYNRWYDLRHQAPNGVVHVEDWMLEHHPDLTRKVQALESWSATYYTESRRLNEEVFRAVVRTREALSELAAQTLPLCPLKTFHERFQAVAGAFGALTREHVDGSSLFFVEDGPTFPKLAKALGLSSRALGSLLTAPLYGEVKSHAFMEDELISSGVSIAGFHGSDSEGEGVFVVRFADTSQHAAVVERFGAAAVLAYPFDPFGQIDTSAGLASASLRDVLGSAEEVLLGVKARLKFDRLNTLSSGVVERLEAKISEIDAELSSRGCVSRMHVESSAAGLRAEL